MSARRFTADEADRMARQVLIGSARLLELSEEDPRELRRRVTSPNGVTHRAIEVLEAGGLGDLPIDAAAAGLRRVRELAVEPAPVA